MDKVNRVAHFSLGGSPPPPSNVPPRKWDAYPLQHDEMDVWRFERRKELLATSTTIAQAMVMGSGAVKAGFEGEAPVSPQVADDAVAIAERLISLVEKKRPR